MIGGIFSRESLVRGKGLAAGILTTLIVQNPSRFFRAIVGVIYIATYRANETPLLLQHVEAWLIFALDGFGKAFRSVYS